MRAMGPTLLAAGLMALLALGMAHASGINGINGGMPSRISMNVTVPKQTQGTTFGEKVNAGLHAAGSAISDFISVFTGIVREIADVGDVEYLPEAVAQEEIA